MSPTDGGQKRQRTRKAAPSKVGPKSQKEVSKLRQALREREEQLGACRSSLEEANVELEALREESVGKEAGTEGGELLLGSPRASYRIEVYPYEGRHLLKVEHLRSHIKKTFPDLDRDRFMEFITAHHPQTGGAPEPSTSADDHPSPPAVEELTGPADTAATPRQEPARQPQPTTPQLRVGLEFGGRPCRVLVHEDLFEASLVPDLGDVDLAAGEPIRHDVTLFAQPVAGGPSRVLGESRGVLRRSELGTIRLRAKAPPEGVYRFRAAATVRVGSGRQITCESSPAGELIQVV